MVQDIHNKKVILLEQILALTPFNLYWKDTHGMFLGCNNNVAKILKLNLPNEIVGKTNYELFNSHLAKLAEDVDKKVISDNKEYFVEETGLDINGNIATYLSNKVPLHDEKGEVVGLLGISVDITDRKKAEKELEIAKQKAEAANQAKTEFLENMRHDIRTPLSGIVGFASVIKEEAKDLKIKEYADNLTASSHALLDYMNEILEAIKVASGDIPLFKQKFDLKAQLINVINLTQSKAASKKIPLKFDYDKKLPQYVIGDPKRIHRIALELISNALTFTEKGSVKCQVTLAEEKENDVIIKLIIEDTGMGIPKEKQAEIFTRFKRLTPSYQGLYKGLGLGLSIAKEFMDDLGGEIYLESIPNDGSKFTCVIPLKKALLQTEEGISETSEEIPGKTFKEIPKALFQTHTKEKEAKDDKTAASHILLIEDDALASDIAQLILSRLHCRVDIAKSGQEAIQLAHQNHYDLIFMDIGLPDMDGYQVTKAIRANHLLDENQVPIVALTAHVDIEHKQQCIEAGMNAVLTKPLAKEKAEDILNAFIPKRGAIIKQKAASKTKKDKTSLPDFNAFPLIDLKLAKKLLSLDDAVIKSLIHQFIHSLPEQAREIEAAYESKDLALFSKLIHKIKGTASYCGAVRLTEICKELQYTENITDAEALGNLYQQFTQTVKALGNFTF